MARYNEIVCPYCHGKKLDTRRFPNRTFKHTDVHFRMETYFEDESKLNNEGKTEDQIRRMADSTAKARLMEQIIKNKPFLCRDDERYNNFWEEFGGSTEENYGKDRKLPFPVYQLPILDPSMPEAMSVLRARRSSHDGSRRKENYFLYDYNGMVVGVEDQYGHETYRRLCPGCHNPLPPDYGKYPSKFISVIGVTSSGKTVYISQLLSKMSKYAKFVDMNAAFIPDEPDEEPEFVKNNPVRFKEPLPRATMPGRLTQPVFCNLRWKDSRGKSRSETLVFYDIAGEDCANANDMMKYGNFVTCSHGIILLLDPSQLGFVDSDELFDSARATEPKTVLNTIHNAFLNNSSQDELGIPVAVCISKSDKIEDILPIGCRGDINPAYGSSSRKPLKSFNAEEYNILQRALYSQMSTGVGAEVDGTLKRCYKHYNYFAFSATGCAVERRNDLYYPVAPPEPRRIAEPLLWLFYKFGYLGSNVGIRLPKPRPMSQAVEEKKEENGKVGLFNTKKKSHSRTEDENETRPLTEEEKERYWYEDRLLPDCS